MRLEAGRGNPATRRCRVENRESRPPAIQLMRERLFFYVLDGMRVAIMAFDDDAAYLQMRQFGTEIAYRAESIKILDIPRNVCPVCRNPTLEDIPCPENRPGCLVYHGCHCTYCGHSPQFIAASNIMVPNERSGFKLSSLTDTPI